MSKLSHFLKHVLGRKTYEDVKETGKALLLDQVEAERGAVYTVLIRAGLSVPKARTVGDEIVERVKSAINK